MPVFVAQTDIEKVWRPLTADEASIIPGLSGSAWIRVLAAFPFVEEQVAAEVIQDAMVSMILRVLKNPESVRILSESIDDHSESKTLDSAVSSGELYVGPHEAKLLTPAPAAPVYGLYVMGLGG